jgi:hypothetical protein
MHTRVGLDMDMDGDRYVCVLGELRCFSLPGGNFSTQEVAASGRKPYLRRRTLAISEKACLGDGRGRLESIAI